MSEPVLEVRLDQVDHEIKIQMSTPDTSLPTVLLTQRGPTGPRGADGATLAPIPFEFNNASPRIVHILTADALVLSVALSITEVFDGDGASVQIGTANNSSLLMEETDSDVSQEIDFENDCFEQLTDGTEILITINPGAGATRGAGFLILGIVNF